MFSAINTRLFGFIRGLFFAVLIFVGAQAHAGISWSSYSATVDAYPDKVQLSYSVAVADCSGNIPYWIVAYRDGVEFWQNYGVGGTIDDTAAVPGVMHSYTIRATVVMGTGCSIGSGVITPAFNGRRAGGPPTAVTMTGASDGTFTDRVRVTYDRPDISGLCTAANYVLVRDGTDVATIGTGVTALASASFDDLTATPGTTYVYSVRTDCTSSSLSSSSTTDSGYAASPPPPAPSSLVCSDGTYTDRVRCTVVAPAAAGCTTRDVVIAIDGVDNTTITTIPVSGGTDFRDITGLTYGSHTFAARSVCRPSNTQSAAISDTGYMLGTPVAPSSVTASDYTFADRVDISANIPPSPQCTFIAVVFSRDGTDIRTDTTIGAAGGVASWSDVGGPFGPRTYGVRTTCSPGGAASSVTTDSGARLGTAPPPSSISASDYAFADRVEVTIAAPDASMCSTRDVILSRDGTDIATITSIPVGGGSATYTDTGATMGEHTYAARSKCNPSGAESTSVTDTGSRAYPTPTCSGITMTTSSIPYSAATTIPVTVNGITNAVSARIDVWNAQNGPNDLFSYPLTGSPTGTATISLANHASGSPEYGTLWVKAILTGSNPADANVECAMRTVPIAPGAPTNFTASDGTQTNSIKFTWDLLPGVGTFSIYQCPLIFGTPEWSGPGNDGSVTLDGQACSLVVSGVPGSASDTTLSIPGTAHEPYAYVIHGTSVDGTVNTPLSNADGGYANRAPTAATATGMLPYGSITPVETTVTVTDVNPSDDWIYTTITTTTARGGTIAASGTSITYTPPADPFIGADTFSFIATDLAGATVTGTGTIDGGCPDPTIFGLSAYPTRIFAGTPVRVDATYGNAGCELNHDATLAVTYASTPVTSSTQTGIPSTASGPLTFDIGTLGSAGYYTAKLTVRNTVTGRSTSRDHTFQVVTYQLPTATITPNALENLQTLTLTVSPSVDCPLTTSATEAAADTSKCLVEPIGLPPGLNLDTSVSYPQWVGVPTTAGTYPVTVRVSQFDTSGTPRELGNVAATTTVLPLSSLVFTAPTPLAAKQYLQPVQSLVRQESGVSCPVTEDTAEAQAAAVARSLRCLVTVDTPPSGFARIPFGIYGTAFTSTVASTPWRVSIFDAGGTEYALSSGSIAVDVTPSDLRYSVRFNPAAPVGSISPVTGTVMSIGDDACSLTTSVDVARDKTRTSCLFEWNTLPSGLTQSTNSTDPFLRGTLTTVGTSTATFTAAVFDQAGNRIDVFSGTASVDATAPPTPTINLTNMRSAAADIYAVPLSGGFYGVLNNCSGCGSVQYTQTITGDTATRTGSIFSPTGRVALTGTPSTLYSQREATLRVALAAAPSVYAEQTFTLLTVPPEDVKLTISIPSAEVPDTLPVTVTAKVGRYTREGFSYTDTEIGQWRVRFGVMDTSGTFVPLTDFVTTDTTGTATGTISPSGYVFMRLVAQAQSITPIPGYSQTIKSTIRVATVVKGSPVQGTVVASAEAGPAPLISQLKVVYATRADQLANQSIAWQSSTDGGSTWLDVPDVSAGTYFVRAPAGVSSYRARFKNRNTSEESYSAPVSVTAWEVPRVLVNGPTYAFPGTPLSFTAVANDSLGSPVAGAVYEWSVSPRSTSNPPPAPIVSGSGASASFTPATAGAYILSYRARYPGSPDADSRSWTLGTKQIVVDAAQKPNIRFTGPARAEVGKTYDYTVSLSAPFPIANSPHTISGEWTLPDGSTRPGTTLSWTPTPADLAISSNANLRYTAWVVGFEGSTTVTTSFPVRLWEYVFPTWTLSGVRSTAYTPTNFAFTAVPSNATLVPTLEGLTYTWSVPPGLSVLGTPSNKMAATAVAGGEYTVSLTVSDARGNSQTVTSTQTAVDPPPFAMSLAISKVSRWSHSPITAGFTPKVTGGHPNDYIVTWKYFVDGVEQTGLPNRSGVQIVLPDARLYNVEAQAISAMGATASQSATVNVPANVPAACSLTATPSSTRKMVALKATCTDPDGSISRLQWFVNGVEKVGLSVSTWTYYLSDTDTLPIEFRLLVTDDGGGITEVTATAN